MAQCECCRGNAAHLARTGRRIWLGCPRCHRTWNVGAENDDLAANDHGAQDTCESSPPVSFIRGYLIAVLTGAVSKSMAAPSLLRVKVEDVDPLLRSCCPWPRASWYRSSSTVSRTLTPFIDSFRRVTDRLRFASGDLRCPLLAPLGYARFVENRSHVGFDDNTARPFDGVPS
jgi:hypothetical protein